MSSASLSALPKTLATAIVFQHALLLLDFIITLLAESALHTIFIVIIVYIFQIVLISTNTLLLYFRLTSTIPFKTGYISLILKEFVPVLVTTVIYLIALCIDRGLGVIKAFECNSSMCNFYSSWGFVVAMVFSRIAAAMYYFVMHKSLVKICTPKYYYKSNWIMQSIT
ncbi:hypothetical protein BDV3_003961 [Batrachochytrium dendrobatidis]|nr:hypothetical protein QVD99_004228 [Batrachochytrium dendrobatidis]